MESADLPEAAATLQQNLYMYHSGARYSSSVMLIYVWWVSTKQRVAAMFYRMPLSISDDANSMCV
jgi:membrane-bound inhibitor of C-type lysozyme